MKPILALFLPLVVFSTETSADILRTWRYIRYRDNRKVKRPNMAFTPARWTKILPGTVNLKTVVGCI